MAKNYRIKSDQIYFSGSIQMTASYAATTSYVETANTASYCPNYLPLIGGKMTGNISYPINVGLYWSSSLGAVTHWVYGDDNKLYVESDGKHIYITANAGAVSMSATDILMDSTNFYWKSTKIQNSIN